MRLYALIVFNLFKMNDGNDIWYEKTSLTTSIKSEYDAITIELIS